MSVTASTSRRTIAEPSESTSAQSTNGVLGAWRRLGRTSRTGDYRGTAIGSKPVAFLLAELGVFKTHSHPYTSTDNPYGGAQFKTLKYRPEFPDRFDSIEHARSFCRTFFDWYNHGHRHSGIDLTTPAAATTDAPESSTPNAPASWPRRLRGEARTVRPSAALRRWT